MDYPRRLIRDAFDALDNIPHAIAGRRPLTAEEWRGLTAWLFLGSLAFAVFEPEPKP